MSGGSPPSSMFHSTIRPSASSCSGNSTRDKSLDPVMMSAGGCFDNVDDATRICGPSIIRKLLSRSNQKKLRHHQKSPATAQMTLGEAEQSSKSFLVSPRQFVSPRCLAKRSQYGSKFYDDLMSVDQAAQESPQENTDEFSRLSVCADGVGPTEEREDSENIPEFVTQLSAEEREQMEKIKREGIPHPLTPKHGQQQRRHTMSGYFDLSPVVEEALPYNLPEKRIIDSPRGNRSTSPQRDIGRLLTTPTASMSSASIIQQIEHLETKNAESQYDEAEEDTQHLQDESSSAGLSSSDKMKLLVAMREIILKQQDALKELADQNTYLKDKLITSAEEIKGMRTESAEKEAWSIRLNLEKEAFEREAKWLREEVKSLRLEVSELKGDDEDLKRRFECLINKSSDDRDTVPCTSSSDDYEYSEPGSFDKEEIHPENSFDGETLSTITDRSEVDSVASPKDSKWWKKMAKSLDQNELLATSSVASTPRRSNSTVGDNKKPSNVHKVEPPMTRKDSKREDSGEESSVEDASVESNSATICGSKAKSKSPPKSYVKDVVSAINAVQKKQEVDMFKNRLDEIQKRRAKRQIEQREFQQMKSSHLLYRNGKK